MKEYDAVIAGGSISGLMTAREIAKKGHSVLVLEEGFEIGTPDHCGGLVSTSALSELGIEPTQKTFDSTINSALIYAPSGKHVKINSKKQKVIVVNRRELDKQAEFGLLGVISTALENADELEKSGGMSNFQNFLPQLNNDGEREAPATAPTTP